ncbi:MAG TPA: SDR family NAD(P)-dependent oxidoreductase, partial [Candidatus Eisenbacteria bacterium]|nr:SDR family NAD(P)-dependent oxidoreductase [Candidatus Eisenbacteria bacterium]
MADRSNNEALSGKVALVTGASRGIGAAAAIRLAQRGAAVVVNYHQNQAAAEKVLDEVKARGARGVISQADVTRGEEIERMVQGAERDLGAIDILVNNAYFSFQVGALHELAWGDFHRAVEHELSAFF